MSSSTAVTPSALLGTGNRFVVEVGAWRGSSAKTSSVMDTVGDAFTAVSHLTGPDQTEGAGGIFTSQGTDPNSGPLLILLAACYWPWRGASVGVPAVPDDGRSTRLAYGN